MLTSNFGDHCAGTVVDVGGGNVAKAGGKGRGTAYMGVSRSCGRDEVGSILAYLAAPCVYIRNHA